MKFRCGKGSKHKVGEKCHRLRCSYLRDEDGDMIYPKYRNNEKVMVEELIKEFGEVEQ